MRRTAWVVSLAAAIALAAFLFLKPLASPAEDPPAGAGAAGGMRAAPHLPVTRVILYSSGVSYVQREGEVEGNARVDLAFSVQDVNDLLKSMVLEDFGGGTVSAASFDSQDPMNKALGSFAVNLATNPSYAELLQQARGEKVEVLLQKNATPLTGTILGVEPGFKELLMGNGAWGENPPGVIPAPLASPVATTWHQSGSSVKPTVAAYHRGANLALPGFTAEAGFEGALADFVKQPARLNLWSAEGMRSIPLPEVQRVRFLNPAMDREVRRALEVLAGARDMQKRSVSLNFSGKGKRKVRVGYVIESPLWRTSYRLLVRDNGKPHLQGWAVVENPTSEDWNNIQLVLVSGCPISFKMDLLQPLYRQRPTVQPGAYGVVPPTTYVPSANAPMLRPGTTWQPALTAPAPTPLAAAPPPPPTAGPVVPEQQPVPGTNEAQINFQRGVIAAALAAEHGDFFQYEIRHAVSLPRQKSAMLPIVSKAIEGSRVSLFNPATHSKFPLLALRLKNTSGVHLTQGPVTIFESAGYAGDAHMPDLRPGETRVLSYAVDLATEVETQAKNGTTQLTSLKIQKGQLTTTAKVRESRVYTAHNRSQHDRTVLIEHPYRPAEYRLVSKVKPVEHTREVVRFELKVSAGKSAVLEVVEEREATGQVALSGCAVPILQSFLKDVTSSPEVKEAVEKALALKNKLSATQQQLVRLQGQLQEISTDQQRLRANLKEMPSTAAAYKRYLAKFDKQETDIEKLQADIRELQDVEARQRQECEAHWGALNIGTTPARAVGNAATIWVPASPQPISAPPMPVTPPIPPPVPANAVSPTSPTNY